MVVCGLLVLIADEAEWNISALCMGGWSLYPYYSHRCNGLYYSTWVVDRVDKHAADSAEAADVATLAVAKRSIDLSLETKLREWIQYIYITNVTAVKAVV